LAVSLVVPKHFVMAPVQPPLLVRSVKVISLVAWVLLQPLLLLVVQ
jgi:hypothetical protein